MSRLRITIAVVACLGALAGTLAQGPPVAQPLGNMPRAIVRSNRALVPFRFLGEWLEATVRYDARTGRVALNKGARTVVLTLNSQKALVDGKAVALDVPAFEIGGRTHVPLRFVAETLLCAVAWNNERQEVAVTSPETGETMLFYVAAATGSAMTSIYTAALEGDDELLKFFMSTNPDYAKMPGSAAWTPLHYAALRGQAYTASYLVTAGADANAKTLDDVTPLHMAAFQGRPELVTYLLAQGADPNAFTKEGHYTALHFAAARGHWRAVEALFEKGVEADPHDFYGKTPLHVASRHGGTRVMELLLAKGATINVHAEDSSTPLHAAVFYGRKAAVKLLLDKGADVNATYADSKRTALHLAAIAGLRDITELLLGKNAEVSAKDAQGVTPLHLAASVGNRAICAVLLQRKAEVNAKAEDGTTPLKAATLSEVRSREVEDLLKRSGGTM